MKVTLKVTPEVKRELKRWAKIMGTTKGAIADRAIRGMLGMTNNGL